MTKSGYSSLNHTTTASSDRLSPRLCLRPLACARLTCASRRLASAAIAAASHNGCLIRPLVAAIVHPADLDFVAFVSALELEREEGILRDRRPPLRGEDGLAVAGCAHLLDEPRGDGFAL